MFHMKYDKEKMARLIARYKAVSKTMPGAIGQEVYKEAEAAMTVIKSDDVPRKTGNLASTGKVDTPQISGSAVKIRAHFGGQAATYAIRVHEDPNMFHPHGRYKYLSAPMRERFATWREAVKRGVKIALTGGRS